MIYAFVASLLGLTSLIPHTAVPASPLAWGVLLAMVFLSVQWGRGRWLPTRWLRFLMILVSTIAAIVLPFFVGATFSAASSWQYGTVYIDSSPPGLSLDGERVRNIFAYDAEGNPIDDVQLFTQDGTPLTTVGSATDASWDEYFYGGGGPTPVPLLIAGRGAVWNVFPLDEIPADEITWSQTDTVEAVAPDLPFASVTPIEQDDPTPSVTPSASDAATGE